VGVCDTEELVASQVNRSETDLLYYNDDMKQLLQRKLTNIGIQILKNFFQLLILLTEKLYNASESHVN
jgi:hypothetical protein